MPNIILTSTFISEPIKPSILYWLSQANLSMNILFTPYNQVLQQLIDVRSEIRNNLDGVNVILLRFEDWHDGNANCENLRKNIEQFTNTLTVAANKSKSPFLVCICPFSPSLTPHLCNLFLDLGKQFTLNLQTITNVYTLTAEELFAYYPISNFYSDFSNRLSHIPYNDDFYTALGTMISRKLFILNHLPYKVIVLDCDNTLWRGACAETGPMKVTISKSFQRLQRFMIKLRQHGKLLCLCSKNNKEDVFAVFTQNPAMVLQKEHISGYRINWEVKSNNIMALSKELQLDLSSFIFIDDNPVECAEVKSALPEVLTLQLPNQEKDFLSFLNNVWAFDHLKVTEEDKNRANTYQEKSARDCFRNKAPSLKEFINGLELEIEINQIDVTDISRASQLTQRTNQFNLTTIRRSEGEMLNLVNDGIDGYTVKVKDRFGDYGLVGLLFLKLSPNIWSVDTFLLSCRILGRGIEHALVSWLGHEALKRNINKIEFNYVPTKRNKPVYCFLQSITNIKSQTENTFILSADQAAKITFQPDTIPYSEAISEATLIEVKHEDKNQSQSNKDLSFTQLALELNSVTLIQQAINHYFLKERHELGIDVDYIEPTDEFERNIAKIWEHAFQIKRIGIEDNFFHLGGNSLLAAQIISNIYNKFNAALNLTDLYNYPTIRKLLNFIKESSPVEVIKPQHEEKEMLVPLSFAQRRIWFLDQLIENKTVYNVHVTLCFKGELQVELLHKSLDLMLKRHSILRVRVKENNGEPYQEVIPASLLTFPLIYEDLMNNTQSIDSRIETVISQYFNTSSWPLFKAALFKVNDHEHTFCLVTHHIITDARSLDIFFNELFHTYHALNTNNVIELPNLPLEYAHFSFWQHKQFAEHKWDRQLEFWKNSLSDAPYVNLPVDHPRLEKLSYQGSCCHIKLNASILEKMKNIAKTNQATLFLTMLSIFQIFLYRYSGQDDLIIGVPVANRSHPDLNNLLGFFVNTLALRFRLNKQFTFIHLLNETKKVFVESYKNQDAPFEKVVESLHIKRDANRHPLFSTVFTHREERIIDTPIENLNIEFLDHQTKTTQFDLVFISKETTNSLMICIEYASDLFNQETIENMLVNISGFIAAAADNPEKTIIELLRYNQTNDLKRLSVWNNTKTLSPKHNTIHQWFEIKAKETPNAIAISFQGKQLTYNEINTKSHQLAYVLQQYYNVNAGLLIPICMDACPNYIISILAILKIGCAYVPIDPEYPPDRVSFILEEINPTLLLTTEHLINHFPIFNGTIINVNERFWEEMNVSAKINSFESINQPSSVAYVIYTSGSTGKPKGVMIEHHSVCNFVQSQIHELKIHSAAHILQLASMCFDISVHEWATTLLSGATLFLISSDIKRNPEQIAEICNQNHISHLILTPSLLSLFSEITFTTLKVIIFGGEMCSENLLSQWRNKVPVLINAYGPTETTIFSSFYRCQDNKPSTIIGRPIDNTEFYILDEEQQLLPIGMAGELYIGGEGLARGYLHRDDLTREKFLQTSFGRLYKTGDLARFLSDGNIQYLGRIDNQVKIRGHRIELAEVEYVLLLHSEIQQAVVIMHECDASDQQLIAYITLQNNINYNHELSQYLLRSILANLEQKLPRYMVPSGFVVLNEMPLLPTGKINRRKLSMQTYPIYRAQCVYAPPRNEIEFALSKIFKDILRIDQIGIDDDFFMIGGNSLLAVSLVTKLQNVFNHVVHLKEVYKRATISYLAQVLSKKMHKSLILCSDNTLLLKCLFPIQTKGDRPPLFIVHPSFGLALPYLALSRYFAEQPIYGLSNPHFAESKNKFSSIEAMATFYVNVIQTIQSHGPYTILGWSFGGVVGLEIAKQLQQKGESLANIIMIDSYHPNQTENESEISIEEFLTQQNIIPQSHEGFLFKTEMQNNIELLKNYVIAQYSGSVILLKAQQDMPLMNEYNGWEKTITPFPRIYNIPGRHEQLFDSTYIKSTVAQLKQIIYPFSSPSLSHINQLWHTQRNNSQPPLDPEPPNISSKNV